MHSSDADSGTSVLPKILVRQTILVAVIAALAVAGMGFQSPASAAPKPAVVVKMSDKPPRYIPETITIKVGQTVKWINNAHLLHNVTTNPESVINKADVESPAGAKPIDSGFMAPGQEFSYTFTVPGKYKYTCLPHEKDGMVGYVIVKK